VRRTAGAAVRGTFAAGPESLPGDDAAGAAWVPLREADGVEALAVLAEPGAAV